MDRIGFVGLGRMGLPMARNLLEAGFAVTGYDIDPGRRAMLVAGGGTAAADLAEAVQGADMVISIIMSDAILHRIALDGNGILANLSPDALYCDLSTVSPAASEAVASAAVDRGIGYLCGKVAGSIGLAEAGALTLFTSGDEADFRRAETALGAMAQTVRHVGTASEAAYLKLVHSAIVGTYSALIGETLSFGMRGGLDLGLMLEILEAGPLGSRQLTLKAPILASRDFDTPPSDIDTAAKDMDLILDTARLNKVPLPLASSTRQVMAFAQATGGGKRDIYSILESFESLAGRTS